MKMHDRGIKMFCRHRLITTLLLLLVLVTGAQGTVTQAPKNGVVQEGRTAEFTCCSDIQKLFYWTLNSTVSQSAADINDMSGLFNGFRKSGRFNVTQGKSPGCYSLIISDIRLEDAGTYKCTDNAGLGQSTQWGLTILESFDCEETSRKDEYMGVNDFGLLQDVITISCVSKYFGYTTPKTKCALKSGTHLSDKYQRITKKNLTTTLNIQMPATKDLNEDQLFCYANIEMQSSDNRDPSSTWKSAKFVINYPQKETLIPSSISNTVEYQPTLSGIPSVAIVAVCSTFLLCCVLAAVVYIIIHRRGNSIESNPEAENLEKRERSVIGNKRNAKNHCLNCKQIWKGLQYLNGMTECNSDSKNGRRRQGNL